MKIKVQRLDTTLPMPEYHTNGSAGLDLVARVDTIVEPNTVARIPANVIIEIPKEYFLLIALRSSTPGKYNLLSPHGVGIIDSDYRGPKDEISVQVMNFSKNTVVIKRGERIAQAIFVPYARVEWEEVDKMEGESRGGFGSTGHK